MGNHNLERFPYYGSVPRMAPQEAVTLGDSDFNTFPAPLSFCGCFHHGKAVFGLARGRAVNLFKLDAFAPTARTQQTIAIDAIGNGEYDGLHLDPELHFIQVVKFSQNRRSNLAASLMMMPPYFYAACHYSSGEVWGTSGFRQNYQYEKNETRFDVLVLYDWSVDKVHPLLSPYPQINETTHFRGEAVLRTFPRHSPYFTDNIATAYFLGEWALRITGDPAIFDVELVAATMNSDRYFDPDQPYFHTIAGSEFDDVATILGMELSERGWPQQVRPLRIHEEHLNSSYPEDVAQVYEDISSGDLCVVSTHPSVSAVYIGANSNFELHVLYGFSNDYSETKFRRYYTNPKLGFLVSRAQFFSGFVSRETNSYTGESLSSHVSFPDVYRWFSHVFIDTPEPVFSWSRQPWKSHALE